MHHAPHPHPSQYFPAVWWWGWDWSVLDGCLCSLRQKPKTLTLTQTFHCNHIYNQQAPVVEKRKKSLHTLECVRQIFRFFQKSRRCFTLQLRLIQTVWQLAKKYPGTCPSHQKQRITPKIPTSSHSHAFGLIKVLISRRTIVRRIKNFVKWLIIFKYSTTVMHVNSVSERSPTRKWF